MQIALLGPVEIRAADRAVDAGPRQQRHVLAVLAAEAGRPVPVDQLVDRVWDEAPSGARQTLQVYLTRLRRLLARAAPGGTAPALVRRSGGYVLDIEPDRVDLLRFRDLLDRARGRSDREQAGLLRTALDLWAGEPLAGLPGGWAERMRRAWRRQHLDTLVTWADLELRCGNAGAVLGPLTEAVGEFPLVEPLSAVLMRGLHRAGRTADALACYAELRHRLAEELGTDPSPEVRETYRAILRADAPDGAHAVRRPVRRVPAQLPVDTAGFVARVRELARLTDALDGSGEGATATTVLVLSGTAGVGKTALAVHWAHRVRDRFPDGQLHVNLRGFDRTGDPMDSAAAVRVFLGALGVPAEGVPAEPEGATALYRTLLADRRVLILVDNARDAAQARPLLPGAAGCLVLVTSRDDLAGLVAAEGARPVHVGLFGPDEARQLLAHRLGAPRVAAEPEAVEEIVARCAGLPLALTVVAARAATKPTFPLVRFAAQLRAGRLDALAAGDPVTDVRTVFSWSYRWLSPAAARLFRLLGLAPGPDIATPAAASLAGLPAGPAHRLLAELTQAHLVTEHRPGRFHLHDLLRAYAAELTAEQDADADRAAAVHRLLDHYLHTGDVAAVLVEPHRERAVRTPPRPGVLPEPLADERAALDWFTAEHQVLLAAVRLAVDAGSDRHAWQLARVLAGPLDNQGRWPDLVTVAQLAIEATRRLDEPAEQARAQRFLGRAYAALRRYAEAEAAYRSALEWYARLGDTGGRAAVHFALACLAESRQRWSAMHEHAAQTLRLYTDAGYEPGIGRALNLLGWVHALARDFDESLRHCHQALALQEKLGDRVGQAATWDSIGYVHHHRGEHGCAVDCYERALALYRRCGDRYNEADVLVHLGDTHRAAGRHDAARVAWGLAEQIFDDLGNARAEAVRARLADPGPVEVPPPARP
ncbi:BTAD domain-containing putative transcriptional regulator [Micromonospora chersina]|uniref:AfsR/SARP family transcriptional regulator n=1 Tax=Micromonospora chersina TaxID=47854 RepID=UPI0037B37C20